MSKILTYKTVFIFLCFTLLIVFSTPLYAVESGLSSNTVEGNIAVPIEASVPASSKKAVIKSREIKEKAKNRVKETIETRTEKMASREAKLKAKLESFKDKRKAEITERVSKNLNKLNENHTSVMQKYLTSLTSILDKLEARLNRSTSDIKDPAATKAAIETARANIASASAAVISQAQKDYTVTVSSEAKAKTEVKTQRDKLHTDLTVLRKIIIDTKQSVINAIKTAKSGQQIITPIEKPKEGTESGQ